MIHRRVHFVLAAICVMLGGVLVPPLQSAPSPSGAAPAGGLTLRFLNVTDGGKLAAQTGGPGFPMVSLSLEVGVTQPQTTFPGYVYVDSEGLDVGFAINTDKNVPFRAEFKWAPLHGNGKYVLVAKALSLDRATEVEQRLAVEVTGIPAGVPSPLDKIIQAYREKLGLTLPSPVVARFDNFTDPSDSNWISTAYIGPTLYHVNVWDSGRVWSGTYPVGIPQAQCYCRPAGRLRLLVVFVDYRNTDLSREAALGALTAAAKQANAELARCAADAGWKAPILELDVAGAYVSPPPSPGKLVTAAQVKSLAGIDPARFDLLVQVDLDSAHSFEQTDPKKPAGGITFKGCNGSGAREVNIWIELKGGPQPESILYFTLLSHELAHAFGWQHVWPLGGGSGSATRDWKNENPTWPTRLFGWIDSDGDGLPEIIDPTPYGLKK